MESWMTMVVYVAWDLGFYLALKLVWDGFVGIFCEMNFLFGFVGKKKLKFVYCRYELDWFVVL